VDFAHKKTLIGWDQGLIGSDHFSRLFNVAASWSAKTPQVVYYIIFKG
jgi:hypothetical protein